MAGVDFQKLLSQITFFFFFKLPRSFTWRCVLGKTGLVGHFKSEQYVGVLHLSVGETRKVEPELRSKRGQNEKYDKPGRMRVQNTKRSKR